MRKIIVLVFVLLLLTIPMTAVRQAEAVINPWEEAGVCAYAAYHPGFAYQCAMMIMFELWNPLDWGDSPSPTIIDGGGADDVIGSPGDSDDIAG